MKLPLQVRQRRSQQQEYRTRQECEHQAQPEHPTERRAQMSIHPFLEQEQQEQQEQQE
eukprot:CAMPEP_0185768332 /NCGR_PEP_ID=MMETSP1174-20130828/49053_1 /TAXON_ID=35687 /ORGANISM="Dictyocha speculum, Strain CCMP1381" /LENGTH=57 /DNA_ID=CAMNT_0028452973 /DNA_START=110 /DNA_END=280 /DNA_ORIENTATION=+